MPTLRYVDTESVSEGGESETKDQVPRQKRPVDTNHKAKASATVAAAAASCNTATEANQTPHQRRPVDANHCAGSTVVAAAADGAASPAGTADSNKAPKSWKKLHGRGDGTNNTAPAQNPSLPSSTNTSPAKGGQSVRPVAPTKKIRRSCSMPNCIKPSRGPRYNHMCSIHMSEDSAGTGSASASRFKGTGDRTHRPPRQQKTASALKKSREPALGVDRDAADQKIPTAPSTPPLISSKAATGKSPMNFLFKLYAMLDDASSDDPDRDCQVPGAPSKKKLSQIVAFQPSGRAFKIHDDKVFRSHVLPLYFGKASFLTFKHLMNHCECIVSVGCTSPQEILDLCFFVLAMASCHPI